MTTMQDVARAAGVSTATVSRVLNGRSDVNPEMAARVAATIKELGYRPNGVARNLRRRVASVWGLIVSDVESSYFTSLVRGVEAVARANGYSVVVCNSQDDPEAEAAYLEVALDEQMAGVILSPARPDSDVTALVARGVPVVTIDRRLATGATSAVVVDNVAAAHRATTHLLDAGYARIACVTGPQHVSTAVERLQGYRDALRDRGVPADPALERIENYRVDGGRRAVRELAALPAPPDALLLANGLLTVGALSALHELGLAIPEQVGVVGFDDSPWAEVTHPPLTTVAQPTDALGRAAAELLLASGAPVVRTLDTELVVRGSSTR
jgi:LacI family transcriptional regulator